MSNPATFEDAFNLLCGDKIGEGIHRTVYNCRLRDDLVVKVESQDFRYFANVMEDKFWADNSHYDKVAQWLAPIEFLSPDARIMLQHRTQPIRDTDDMPDKIPSFLTDVKRENFGWLNDRLVCHDYAFTITNPSVRLRKAEWS